MEAEMACKCGATMYREGNQMICPNVVCGRRYDIPERVAPQAELLKENQELKERIIALEDIIEKLTEETYHDKKRTPKQSLS